MATRTTLLLFLVLYLTVCDASQEEFHVESRGKKKKIALFVFFADLIIKKIFVLKLVYAFVLWVVIHKAGYFLGWFASYLKEQKNEWHHDHHGHHDHHEHYAPYYGPYRKGGYGGQLYR